MTRRDVLRSAAAATLTEAPMRFLRYETVSLAGPRAVTYRLRGGDASAVIRHGTRDIDRLVDCFGRRPVLPAAAGHALIAAGDSPRCVDLGAGPGLAALALLAAYPGARVTSVEPDPMNLVILRRTISANPLYDGWVALPGAVGDGGYLRGPGYARHLAPGTTDAARRATATPVDALELLDGADLVRLDLQGAEWELLSDPRFMRIAPPVVVLEPHGRGCPGPDPVAEGAALLTAAGYRLIRRPARVQAGAVLFAWRGA